MKTSLLTTRTARLSAIAVLAVAVGASGIAAAHAGNGLGCEINVARGSGGVSLSGVVHANKDVEGSYAFRITKSGGGGSSDISQSGDFSVAAGSSESVGSVSLGGDGSYRARLDIRTPLGSTSCSQRIWGGL